MYMYIQSYLRASCAGINAYSTRPTPSLIPPARPPTCDSSASCISPPTLHLQPQISLFFSFFSNPHHIGHAHDRPPLNCHPPRLLPSSSILASSLGVSLDRIPSPHTMMHRSRQAVRAVGAVPCSRSGRCSHAALRTFTSTTGAPALAPSSRTAPGDKRGKATAAASGAPEPYVSSSPSLLPPNRWTSHSLN